jgi:chemotaxis signal transduction protein
MPSTVCTRHSDGSEPFHPNGEMPWVLVTAGPGLFALSTRHVQEMASTPAVTRVPLAPHFVRGVINLRGHVMPLVDLRLRFGLVSQAQEVEALVELLRAREQDHRRWLDELVASVRERRTFALTTDPHACAFGKWYDTFRTDNLLFENVLKRFDTPHRRIHEVGAEIVRSMQKGTFAGCEAIVEGLRGTTLQALLDLFTEARAVLRESSREIAVVLSGAGPTYAVAVDAIASVERLTPDALSSLDDSTIGVRSECVDAVARRARDSRLVLTVDAGRLLGPAIAVQGAV